MHSIIHDICTSFAQKVNAHHAERHKKYMRNQFDFLGLTTPQRRAIEKEVFKRHQVNSQEECHTIIKQLWELPEREYQYCALGFAYYHRKKLSQESLALCEYLIRTKFWWDTVDCIAVSLVGNTILRDSINPMDIWIQDSYLWINRVAIICQIQKKHTTDEKRLFDYCLLKATDKDFFIRKAIGWALRAYAKTCPEQVKNFVSAYHDRLSGLSIREASKYLT